MKKILMLFLAVFTASVAVDLNAMRNASTPGGFPDDNIVSLCTSAGIDSSTLTDPTVSKFIETQAKLFEYYKNNPQAKGDGKPGLIAQALISTFSGIVSYTAKYVIIIATIYLAAGYLNVPAVQGFIKELLAVASFNFGQAFIGATTTIATGAASGIANYTMNNPIAAAETAGILSVIYWGPVAALTAVGTTLWPWMKLRMLRK